MSDKYEPMFLEYDDDTQPIAAIPEPETKLKRQTPKPKAKKQENKRRKSSSNLAAVLLLTFVGAIAALAFSGDLANLGKSLRRKPGCTVGKTMDRAAEMSVDVIIHGSKRHHVTVDVIPPGRGKELSVQTQYHKTFIDTGEPYIHQVYAWDTEWESGQYTITHRLSGKPAQREVVGLNGNGAHRVFVECN